MINHIKYFSVVLALTTIFVERGYSQLILSSPNTTGAYTDAQIITMNPGFSTATAQPFSASVVPLGFCYPLNTVLSTDQNYIVTYTPQEKGITNPSDPNLSNCQMRVAVEYFDGLGRSIQTVQVKGDPSGTKDVIQPMTYDDYGREAVKYLPYASASGPAGAVKANALTEQALFYAGTNASLNKVTANNSPFMVTKFEPSPLNTVLEQGAPGDAWQPAPRTSTAGRTVITEFELNKNVNTDRQVRNYKAITVSGHLHRLVFVGWYPSGKLNCTITKDESWTSAEGRAGTIEEYKDNEGRLILKRTWETDTKELLTYYVYDDFGNLCYVLPPGANGSINEISKEKLANFCFQYRYDGRNRIIEKKMPGKGWEYIIYNKLDQVIASQDSSQRMNNPQQASFIKYDAHGRVVIRGEFTIAGSPGTNQRVAMQNAASGLPSWENRTNSGANMDYSNLAYPVSNLTVTQISYYDSYNNIPDMPMTGAPATMSNMVIGRLTASKTFILNNVNHYLWQVLYYDDDGHMTTTYKQHYKGGASTVKNYDLTDFTYNFNDQVTTSQRRHFKINSSGTGSDSILTVMNKYIYDHMGRKIKTWQRFRNAGQVADAAVLLSQLERNGIGQVTAKYLHATDTGSVDNFKQKIEYTYNERGWLKSSAAPLFAAQLDYNVGSNPQFNGNIAKQQWGVPGNLNKSYTYTYDKLNRLTSGISHDLHNEDIVYDNMGNITRLSRYSSSSGALTKLDDIEYSYTLNGVGSNQLQSANDISGNDAYMPTGNWAFTYDGNGNVKIDPSKGISSITYNVLNLPETVMRTGGNSSYFYTADGEKVRRQFGSTFTDYINGIHYSEDTLDFIQTEEGRAIPNGPIGYTYEYSLTDHLGSSRAGFDVSNNTARLVQTDNYYPFGASWDANTITSPKNDYLFNKKEKQDNLGGLYDYGARFYDPILARWGVIDRFAEKYAIISPYQYVNNNPVRNVDAKGDSIIVTANLRGDSRFWDSFNTLKRTSIGAAEVRKFVRSSTEDIYISSDHSWSVEREGKTPIMYTIDNAAVEDGEVSTAGHLYPEDFSTLKGHPVKAGNKSHIMAFDAKNVTKAKLDKYLLAFAIFHEMRAHIDFGYINDEAGEHKEFGNYLIPLQLHSGIDDIPGSPDWMVWPGTDAWDVLKQILTLKKKDGEATEQNIKDLNEMMNYDKRKKHKKN
jgi:RHS repeat-associated protein